MKHRTWSGWLAARRAVVAALPPVRRQAPVRHRAQAARRRARAAPAAWEGLGTGVLRSKTRRPIHANKTGQAGPRRPVFFWPIITSGGPQRAQQIGLDIEGIFKAHRKPHHPVGDSLLLARLGGEPLVGRRRRMRDEALGIAQ